MNLPPCLRVASLVCGVLLGLVSDSAAWKAFGKVKCGGHPLSHVNVKLVTSHHSFHKILGSSRSRTRGNFVTKGKFDIRHRPVYLMVDLEYDGFYGRMAIESKLGLVRSLFTPLRRSSNSMNYDNTNFNNPLCHTFMQFYYVIREFNRRTEERPLPFSLLQVRTDTRTAENEEPNVISLEQDKAVTFQSARLMFGRALLYGYDERLWEKSRVISQRYPQIPYGCGEKSDEWIAFQEGWANFWADECHGTYGTSSVDFSYQGNVAQALRDLRTKCANSWTQMLKVLKGNRNNDPIENFRQYDFRHNQFYSCKLLWVYKM